MTKEGVRELLLAPKVRTLLALLLCRPRAVVPATVLIDGLWRGDPPRSAAKNLQLYVHQLRRALGEPERVALRSPGYALEVHPDELDAERFEALAGQARLAHERADFRTAGTLARQAIALWRGTPFCGLADEVRLLQAEAERLLERKLVVTSMCVEAELRLGRHRELVAELLELVAEHPLREGLHAQLMLALYRSGRQAEALEVYWKVRRVLAEDLGLEPGAEVCELAQAILRADPALEPGAAGAAPTRPTQLPPDVATFTGRAELLRDLDAAADRGGVPVVVVSGTAGVGKTALALHWSHRALDRFPDGQLYVNLHGYAPTAAVSAAEALVRFLRALGVPAERIPAGLDELTALFRSTIGGRRMLVLLDDAASVEQVRPLLPGRPGSVVLITSRDDLRGLAVTNDAAVSRLDVLTAREAGLLLERIIGAARVEAERQAADELVALCARLPLALRVAGAGVASGGESPIADCVAGLRAADRLDRLSVAGDPTTAVRAAFHLSYRRLDPAVRTLFRLLGVVETPEFSVHAAAALLGVGYTRARRLLTELVRAHLVDVDASGRHQYHDLLRLYAAERATDEDDPDDRAAARARLFDWYLDTAAAATAKLTPHVLRLTRPDRPAAPAPPVDFEEDTGALAWLEVERANLVAVVRDAAEHGPRPVSWQLADVLRGYFWLRRYVAEWLAVARTAAASAIADGSVHGRIAAEQSLAQAYRSTGDYPRSIEHYTASIELAAAAGWAEAEAAARGNVSGVHWELGRLDEAAAELTRAVRLNRRTGWQAGLGANLHNLGTLCRELGRPHEAVEHLTQALEVHESLRSKSGVAHAHTNLGEALSDLGRLADARRHLRLGLRLHQETGGRYGQVTALICLTALHAETGELDRATECGTAAVELARETGDRRTEASALAALASLGVPAGLSTGPRTPAERALRLAREINYPKAEIEGLLALAGVDLRFGAHHTALMNAEAALEAAARHRLPLLTARARMVLASANLALGRHGEAGRHAGAALDVNRRTGNVVGEGRALGVLGRIALRVDGPAAAAALLRQALDVLADSGSVEAQRLSTVLSECPV
ncbi:DNA-binding SARP family transcriptional activator [Saccharothrix tamanrassetensis]|uniref:DNA-binding SARP family transcriptional activator n=1 Tax=Saccharothrix tamanrassetensis TaxID=1051531 RepID=A0A841CBI3_9PSEU|nr:BTAD domain-containing putative transcriptional regulator [Saccharothrix tamanrassetensis]MBB5953714.1 DNA-binding SARP family transcriptional activator [Saccharothrix tamanrassetensis]